MLIFRLEHGFPVRLLPHSSPFMLEPRVVGHSGVVPADNSAVWMRIYSELSVPWTNQTTFQQVPHQEMVDFVVIGFRVDTIYDPIHCQGLLCPQGFRMYRCLDRPMDGQWKAGAVESFQVPCGEGWTAFQGASGHGCKKRVNK